MLTICAYTYNAFYCEKFCVSHDVCVIVVMLIVRLYLRTRFKYMWNFIDLKSDGYWVLTRYGFVLLRNLQIVIHCMYVLSESFLAANPDNASGIVMNPILMSTLHHSPAKPMTNGHNSTYSSKPRQISFCNNIFSTPTLCRMYKIA